jgi:hypothetical protein
MHISLLQYIIHPGYFLRVSTTHVAILSEEHCKE